MGVRIDLIELVTRVSWRRTAFAEVEAENSHRAEVRRYPFGCADVSADLFTIFWRNSLSAFPYNISGVTSLGVRLKTRF